MRSINMWLRHHLEDDPVTKWFIRVLIFLIVFVVLRNVALRLGWTD